MEEITCRVCGTRIIITRATVCPGCKEEIFTRGELLQSIREKEQKIETLKGEIGAARAELFSRAVRVPKPLFWENMKPITSTVKSGISKPAVSVKKAETKITIPKSVLDLL